MLSIKLPRQHKNLAQNRQMKNALKPCFIADKKRKGTTATYHILPTQIPPKNRPRHSYPQCLAQARVKNRKACFPYRKRQGLKNVPDGLRGRGAVCFQQLSELLATAGQPPGVRGQEQEEVGPL